MSGRLDRRAFLVCAGQVAAGGGLAATLPGWTGGTLRQGTDPRLVELAGLIQGTVVSPSDATYDTARRLYSPRYDGVRPGAVVFCASAQDVWRTVRWARRHGIRVVPRCGGHSYAGYSTCLGVVVDVTRMNGVTVDAAARTATVGAGALLIDVNQALSLQGVAIPAGSCPTVGIAGLTLGGGHGFSGRAWGLACDSLVSLVIVTASGQALLASKTQHPDLFWACRGGGAGQFGIVTGFKFATRPASNVVTYRATWPWSDAAAVVAAWQAWAPHAPDELFSMCDLIATDGPGGPIVASNGQYFGSEAGLQTLLQPLVSAASPQTMIIRTRSFINASLDWANCSEWARCHLVGTVPNAEVGRSDFVAKSDYVASALPTAGIQAMIQRIEQRQNDPALGGGSVLMDAYGGAINRVPKDATAFVHRDQLFSIQYVAASSTAADVDWLRSFRAAMGPYVSGQAYQNYVDPDLDHPNLAYYASNYARLRQVKRRYDPTNVFRFPRSVVPAPAA
ncbi:MAG TPA: FAD-binding oxidoreductase [Gaiellaceae bacterium]